MLKCKENLRMFFKIWKKGNIQHPEAEIEIDCFDSSFTIVKFKKEATANLFYKYFNEAVKLEEFK